MSGLTMTNFLFYILTLTKGSEYPYDSFLRKDPGI